MRRALLLTGVWLFGAGIAVAFSFAAVGRVASGVTPSNGSALSRQAIDNELTTGATRQPHPGSALSSTTISSPASPGSTSTTRPSTRASTTTRPQSTTAVTPATGSSTPASPSGRGDTVTTSQGGTIWTRCSGPDTIVYLAAIPKAGYQRTLDVEAATGVEQQFQSGTRFSKIQASCSNGVVHAEVEEDAGDS